MGQEAVVQTAKRSPSHPFAVAARRGATERSVEWMAMAPSCAKHVCCAPYHGAVPALGVFDAAVQAVLNLCAAPTQPAQRPSGEDALPDLKIAGHLYTLQALTLADTAPHTLRDGSAALFKLFVEREAEFKVHPSVVIHYPDVSDTSNSGFLADAAAYVARQAASMVKGGPALQTVVLTTYGDRVWESLEAAGYAALRIDMPAGPEHTAAFVLAPSAPCGDVQTLYIEAVNEDDEKIRPSFMLQLTDANGRLCGGACGAIHEREGKRYAYLATMAMASGMPTGSGTALGHQLVQFLRSQGVATVHLGTQTAGRFYTKLGFKVDHVLVRKLRVRHQGGLEIPGDLVMLSMDL